MIDLKKIIKENQEALNNSSTFNGRQITMYGCAAEIFNVIMGEILNGEEKNPMSMEMTTAVISALEAAKQTLLEPFLNEGGRATVDTNINATISAIKRAAEHPEQPQSESERKPVRLIDANSIRYTTMQIGHSHGAEPPETFAYKEDIDKLPTVEIEELEIVQHLREISEARGRLIEKYKSRLDEAIREREAAIDFIKYLDRNYSSYMTEDEKFTQWR